MAGVYIHIPFCTKACHYCDFYFSTSLNNKESVVSAIHKEIGLRKDYLQDKNISTIYFGGGTPSLLNYDELAALLDDIRKHFKVASAEITLEANPDDLNKEKLQELKRAGINRLSIGIQSFYDEDLVLMNRSHNSGQAVSAVKDAQDAGFSNISVDLIYGLPNLTMERWQKNMQQAFDLQVPHLSAYSLTVETRTALHDFVKKGKVKLPAEAMVIEQFMALMEAAQKNGFVHYEISNFAKPGMESKHNSSYWKNEHYLGLGPSAHSFDGVSRQWNIANNGAYVNKIGCGESWFEREELSVADRYNEYIMTRLRTIWGIDLAFVKANFGEDKLSAFEKQLQPFITSGDLQRGKENVFLTPKGKLLADKIASELFIE
jgi:oxygen-independent coproporphyrinogen-3 oxidase